MTSTSESGFSASCQGSDKDEQSHRVLPAEMPDRGPCDPGDSVRVWSSSPASSLQPPGEGKSNPHVLNGRKCPDAPDK